MLNTYRVLASITTRRKHNNEFVDSEQRKSTVYLNLSDALVVYDEWLTSVVESNENATDYIDTIYAEVVQVLRIGSRTGING